MVYYHCSPRAHTPYLPACLPAPAALRLLPALTYSTAHHLLHFSTPPSPTVTYLPNAPAAAVNSGWWRAGGQSGWMMPTSTCACFLHCRLLLTACALLPRHHHLLPYCTYLPCGLSPTCSPATTPLLLINDDASSLRWLSERSGRYLPTLVKVG